MNAIRIRDWDTHFETSESRKRKKLDWVAIPTKMDGRRFRRVGRLPDAHVVLGAFLLMVEVGARCPNRGLLVDDRGDPLDPGELADLTGFPQAGFERAIDVLTEPKIGWLEKVSYSGQLILTADGSPADAGNDRHDVRLSAGTPAKSSPTDRQTGQTRQTGQNTTRQNITDQTDWTDRQKSQSDLIRHSPGRKHLAVLKALKRAGVSQEGALYRFSTDNEVTIPIIWMLSRRATERAKEKGKDAAGLLIKMLKDRDWMHDVIKEVIR